MFTTPPEPGYEGPRVLAERIGNAAYDSCTQIVRAVLPYLPEPKIHDLVINASSALAADVELALVALRQPAYFEALYEVTIEVPYGSGNRVKHEIGLAPCEGGIRGELRKGGETFVYSPELFACRADALADIERFREGAEFLMCCSFSAVETKRQHSQQE